MKVLVIGAAGFISPNYFGLLAFILGSVNLAVIKMYDFAQQSLDIY